jgi:hypothetical protein
MQRQSVKIRMTSSDDLKWMIRRNKLLGAWAAEKLGITGQDAEAYSHALAMGSLDPEHSDVFSKIRGRGPIGRADPTRHERAHARSRRNASNARRCPGCRSVNARAHSQVAMRLSLIFHIAGLAARSTFGGGRPLRRQHVFPLG